MLHYMCNAPQVRTFTALGKHLQALSDQVGGGFESEWYPRLLAKLTRDLSRIVGIELGLATIDERPTFLEGQNRLDTKPLE
jgi:hypothetical protein